MSKANRNAAIWYASDAFDPKTNGINGRRMAGESFLSGFFRHADVDEFVSLARGVNASKDFLALKNRYAPGTPHRAVLHRDVPRIAPLGTVYFPAPNYAELCWRRQAFGMNRYSICGVTHTTATQAVMRGIFDLRAGPQAEWDGVICTSRAVHAATVRNMEIAEAFLRDRFGSVPPARSCQLSHSGSTATISRRKQGRGRICAGGWAGTRMTSRWSQSRG